MSHALGAPPTAVEQSSSVQEGELTAALPPDTYDELPEGWEVVVDPNDPGNVYYWNQKTDATTWNKPDRPAEEDVERDKFLSESRRMLQDALDRWITGTEPFTARLNPDLPGYNDYDQLMRLDEWQGRGNDGGSDEA